MTKRRSLTSTITGGPTNGEDAWSELDAAGTGTHAMRRTAARHEVSERIVLHGIDPFGFAELAHALTGWALNASRGGVRVLLEAMRAREVVLELGREYEMVLGSVEPGESAPAPLLAGARGRPLRARVVWLQEEPDGVIAGLEFVVPLDSEPRLRVQRSASAPRIRARADSGIREEASSQPKASDADPPKPGEPNP